MTDNGKEKKSRGETPADEKKKSLWTRMRHFNLRWVRKPIFSALRIVLLLVIGLSLVGYFFYRTYREDIESLFGDYAEKQTKHLFAPPTTFSRMDMLSLGTFVFHDFRIQDPYDSLRAFIDVSRVKVSFDLLQLFWRGGINLSQVEIYDGSVLIHRGGEEDEVNAQKIFKSRDNGDSSDDDPGMSVRVRNFLLDNLSVRLEDIDDRPIENYLRYMEGSFSRIAHDNVIEVRGSSLRSSYWSIGPARLAGIFTITGKKLGLRNIRFRKEDTNLEGNGFVDFDRRTFEYVLEPGTLDLGHLPPELETRERIGGKAELSAEFLGSFDSTSVMARISIPHAEMLKYNVNELATTLRYTGGTLSFDSLRADVWGGRIRQAGLEFRFRSEDSGYTINADVEKIRLDRLHFDDLDKMDARLSGRFEVEGSGYNAEELFLQGYAERLRGTVSGVAVDSANADFSFRDSRLRIDNMAVFSGRAVATALGDIEPEEMFLFVTLDELPVKRAEEYFDVDSLGGTADFSGTLAGPYRNPSLKGTFTVKEGSYRGFSCDSIKGNCSLAGLADTLHGTVDLDVEKPAYGQASFERLSLRTRIEKEGDIRFSPLVLSRDSLTSISASGTWLRADSSGAGRGMVLVDSLDIGYRGERATTLDSVILTISGDSLIMPGLEISALGGRIEGGLTFVQGRWLETSLSFSGISLARLQPVLERETVISGRVRGELELSGPPGAPKGHLLAHADSLEYSAIYLESVSTSARLGSDRLSLDSLKLVGEQGAVSMITGDIPLGFFRRDSLDPENLPTEELDLRASLERFPITALRTEILPLTRGVLDGDLVISGSAGRPELEGRLELSGGRGIITPINMRLGDMSATLTLRPGEIQLDNFVSSSPEGRISVNGKLYLDGLEPDSLRLDVTGREILLQQFRYVTSVRLNTDLQVSGPVAEPMARGRVRLLSGEVNPSFGGISTVGGGGGQLGGPTQVRLPGSPVNYDISFSATDNFWLRNRNANIKLNAELQATQQQDSIPRISGRITTVAGYYILYGRRFRVRYGYIEFQGQPEINPRLDINAERTVRGKILRGDFGGSYLVNRGATGPSIPGQQYEIDRNTFQLHIGGTLNNPQFDINIRDRDDREIEPSLTEEQARTLVIFDQTYREYQQQASLSQSKLLDQAANMALNQANPYLQEITGLDELSFESQLFNRDLSQDNNGNAQSQRSAKLTVGEFLSESIFFSVSQDLIDPSARSAQIEYLIDRHSSIISQTDSRGHFSIDYRYRIKY